MDEAARCEQKMAELEAYMDQLKDHHDKAFGILTQYANKPLEEIGSGIWYAQCYFADVKELLQPFETDFGLVKKPMPAFNQPEANALDIRVAMTPAQLAEVIRHDMMTRSEGEVGFADLHLVDQTMKAMVEVISRYQSFMEAKLNLEKRMQLIIDGRDWLRGAHRYHDENPRELKGALMEDIRRVNEVPNVEKI